jgi:hypothetical protein
MSTYIMTITSNDIDNNFITYDEFNPRLKSILGYEQILKLSRDLKFVPYKRLSPRKPPLFNRLAVERWLNERLDALEVSE